MKSIQNILIYIFFTLFFISIIRVISLDTVFTGWNTTLIFALSGLAGGVALYKPLLFKGISDENLKGDWIDEKNQQRSIILLIVSIIRIPLLFVEVEIVENISVLLGVVQVIYVITLFNIFIDVIISSFKKS